MNIALPALVVLVGLLPGIAAYYSYFAGRFEKRRAGISALEEAALYVLFAIPIDTAAFLFFRYFAINLDISAAAHLLAGNVPEAEVSRIAALIEAHAGLSTTLYLAIVGGSAAMGIVARRVVWHFRIDTYIDLFKWRHPWYYMFQGRDRHLSRNVLAWVDVLAEHAEDKTRLYRGLVADYDIASDGKLESLTLSGARRGGRGEDFKWIDIPSDHLVLMGCKIHSINVSYYDINLEPDESELIAADEVPNESDAAPSDQSTDQGDLTDGERGPTPSEPRPSVHQSDSSSDPDAITRSNSRLPASTQPG